MDEGSKGLKRDSRPRLHYDLPVLQGAIFMTQDPNTPPPSSDPAPEGTPVVPYATPTDPSLPYQGPPPSQEERTWGMLAHLSALVQFIGVPTFVGPLVVWLIKKDTMPFVNDQGKEALNFQITMIIVAICLLPTLCIVVGFFLLPLLGLYALIFAIVAAIKANEGIAYRYPLTLRLVK
jgi:uncharacterized protein